MKRAGALTSKNHAQEIKVLLNAPSGAGVGCWERQSGESSDRRVRWEAPSVAVSVSRRPAAHGLRAVGDTDMGSE